MYWRITS